ncbi:ATPase [Streptomyces sp. NBC_01433]|uniref:RapZ C-terminal domain-containing protein n=1 Tax=Streptomyces sp. NBC_01433 TaxID=2903864 RepID=UPI00224CE1F5|nr:RNase adapter RapZ [Streptomyces sp. NBC_01433]MCX4681425.1 ATPase [Streptomyces sp. NBC_01433]
MPPADLHTQLAPALIRTVITSYGDGHQDAPRGNALRVDARPLRNPPADPAVRARMLNANGLDPHVRDYVLVTPGADRLIERSFTRAVALLALPDHHRMDIHVLCGGGRHRSVVVAEELAVRLRAVGYGVETEHRHIDHPILECLGNRTY